MNRAMSQKRDEQENEERKKERRLNERESMAGVVQISVDEQRQSPLQFRNEKRKKV